MGGSGWLGGKRKWKGRTRLDSFPLNNKWRMPSDSDASWKCGHEEAICLVQKLNSKDKSIFLEKCIISYLMVNFKNKIVNYKRYTFFICRN